MPTWNADDYSRHSSQQQKWARELIAKLHLRGDEQVLDIGCGDGKVTAELASKLSRGSVVGLDSSPSMIEFARKAFPNLSFVVGDASRLQFSEQFDLIFSNATLHWIYDHTPVLAGISRALKPRGRVVVQMGGQGCAADVLAVLDGMMFSPRWQQYFCEFKFRYGFHGPVEYRQWLQRAELQPIRVELIPKDMTHAGREGLAGWFRTTWIPYIQAVPEKDREAFLDELVSRYLERHPLDADQTARVKMIRLEYEAVKR
jgi:trans-aconitate 2-methyltransferase